MEMDVEIIGWFVSVEGVSLGSSKNMYIQRKLEKTILEYLNSSSRLECGIV
ncbi:MAG: hypothetical protein ACD_11C00068G0002 [uncultured bacterium]|nr:MAG: hypothetical protein ACD_11C00068G0002 [uncultured bacterium]